MANKGNQAAIERNFQVNKKVIVQRLLIRQQPIKSRKLDYN
jgi:hypothetical protein